jgi:hypothetical protein
MKAAIVSTPRFVSVSSRGAQVAHSPLRWTSWRGRLNATTTAMALRSAVTPILRSSRPTRRFATDHAPIGPPVKSSADYPMPQIRAHHTAVWGPGAPDITTNPPLLYRYLLEVQTKHLLKSHWYKVISVTSGVLTTVALITTPYVNPDEVLGLFATVITLNVPFWGLTWYHGRKRDQVTPKLQAVEHQLQLTPLTASAVTKPTA